MKNKCIKILLIRRDKKREEPLRLFSYKMFF